MTLMTLTLMTGNDRSPHDYSQRGAVDFYD